MVILAFGVYFINRIKPFEKRFFAEEQKVILLMIEGLYYIQSQRMIKLLFITFGVTWLVASSIDLIVIHYLIEVTKVGSEIFGVFAATMFLGMMAGAGMAAKYYNVWKRSGSSYCL